MLGTTEYQNVVVLSHHFHDWVTGYASRSNAQTGVQWLATPLSQPDPLQLASLGSSSPAILPTWDRTENLTVISPMPTPTKPRWLWYIRSNLWYICPWTCENVIGIEIWNFKKLTLPGLEHWSSESYPVIKPLDHCLILRKIRNEYINLIWHHLVSHRRVGNF